MVDGFGNMDDRQQDIPGWWIRNSSGNESLVASNRRRAEEQEDNCLSCGLNVVAALVCNI